MNFRAEDACRPAEGVSGDVRHTRALYTCLDYVTYGVEMHRSDEVVYAGYRVEVVSGHEHDDRLR